MNDQSRIETLLAVARDKARLQAAQGIAGKRLLANEDRRPGDVGTTCVDVPMHGDDHVYLVLENTDEYEMLIADNQHTEPHPRWISGKGGKTPTRYFLRAT